MKCCDICMPDQASLIHFIFHSSYTNFAESLSALSFNYYALLFYMTNIQFPNMAPVITWAINNSECKLSIGNTQNYKVFHFWHYRRFLGRTGRRWVHLKQNGCNFITDIIKCISLNELFGTKRNWNVFLRVQLGVNAFGKWLAPNIDATGYYQGLLTTAQPTP